ncbi:MAG: hypothetical protein NVSMB63_10460 [Sediminibacterium sp.]
MIFVTSCSKNNNSPVTSAAPASFNFASLTVNGRFAGYTYYNTSRSPEIRLSFSAPINRSTVRNAFNLTDVNGIAVNTNVAYAAADSVIIIQPALPLAFLSRYALSVTTDLQSKQGGSLQTGLTVSLITVIDSTPKFPLISDDSLLTLVQQRTFRYFWDFGHPASGMARERNTSGDVVTTGGSGFGIMAIPVAVERSFISRTDGLARMQQITAFLKNTAQRFHGTFPHWMNGVTGKAVPFSARDNGADLVETAYLVQGLLTAKQYFNGPGTAEVTLRNDINTIWTSIEWNWFRQNNQQALYWHWSPDYNWEINMPIKGWNEALITYVLAAASPAYSIPKTVYDNGWAGNGSIVTNYSYYNYSLPLGPPYGGPLFFSHYSFLGINPNGLADAYAHYDLQTKNHALINYTYCRNNPKGYFGYSDSCWGLTASDIPSGYAASSPANDIGVIAPTAAIASFPYTPEASMKALKFFYYVLGDKIWKDYGFTDAFSLQEQWFASSYLAIDQGPEIIMIENYRSGLPWKLFTSCPEVKLGLSRLGFTAPYL